MHLVRRVLPSRFLTLLALGIAALGCSDGPRPRLWVSFDARGEYADPARLGVTVQQGMVSWIRAAETMQQQSRTNDRFFGSSGPLTLEPGRELTVEFRVATTSGGTVTETLTFEPQEGWDYGAAAVIDTITPHELCANVASRRALPTLAGGPVDTLFVMRSGLGRGSVC